MCDVTHVEGDGGPEENPLAAELDEHRARIADGARPGAMAKRAATGHRSVRENIRDFVGAGTFHEYGSATIEVQTDAVTPGANVLVVDDVLATGGTAVAACELIEKVGGRVACLDVLVELAFLPGRERLDRWELHTGLVVN
mgnify:CR=1 FL=1